MKTSTQSLHVTGSTSTPPSLRYPQHRTVEGDAVLFRHRLRDRRNVRLLDRRRSGASRNGMDDLTGRQRLAALQVAVKPVQPFDEVDVQRDVSGGEGRQDVE